MSFRPIIKRWPSKSALAADLGLKHFHVQAWWHRDSIPGDWDTAIVSAAAKRGYEDVSLELLADTRAKVVTARRLNARRRRDERAEHTEASAP